MLLLVAVGLVRPHRVCHCLYRAGTGPGGSCDWVHCSTSCTFGVWWSVGWGTLLVHEPSWPLSSSPLQSMFSSQQVSTCLKRSTCVQT